MVQVNKSCRCVILGVGKMIEFSSSSSSGDNDDYDDFLLSETLGAFC